MSRCRQHQSGRHKCRDQCAYPIQSQTRDKYGKSCCPRRHSVCCPFDRSDRDHGKGCSCRVCQIKCLLATCRFKKLCQKGLLGKTLFCDDFRDTTSEFLSSVFSQTGSSIGIFPAFVPTSNWGGSAWFDPQDEKLPDGVTHVNGKLSFSNIPLNDRWKGVNMALCTNFGLKGKDVIRVRFVASFDFELPIINPYGMVVHPGGLQKDVRFVQGGVVATLTPGVKTICFFMTKTSVWAFSDSGADLTGSHNPGSGSSSGWVYGRQVANFNTCEPHFYELEYDRGKDRMCWFIDGQRVFVNNTPGLLPPLADGDVLTERNNRDRGLKKFDNLAINVTAGVIFGQTVLLPGTQGLEVVESIPQILFLNPTTLNNVLTERDKVITRNTITNLHCLTIKRIKKNKKCDDHSDSDSDSDSE